MAFELQSEKNVRSLVTAIDTATAFKNLNLKSGINALLDAQTDTVYEYAGSEETESTAAVPLASGKRLAKLLDYTNQRTGYNDGTLTEAVQRLCDGYDGAVEEPLYHFGLLSDVHIQYETGVADLQRALTYFSDNADVDFVCICGDLVSYASEECMTAYKDLVSAYSAKPVYECAGNHETFPAFGVGGTIDETLWKNTTGKDLYYSFEHEGDVFLFLSIYQHTANNLFPEGGLAWLEETLEENKNKRCFVFQHIPQSSVDRAADPSGSYDSGMLEGTDGKAFIELMKKYKNTVFFHGHTHFTFDAPGYPLSDADVLGYRSVHIPSLASPRFYNAETGSYADSYVDENGNTVWGSVRAEGYVVSVYKNKIVLQGMDFAAGDDKDQVMGLANEFYALDTTVQTVESDASA